MKCNGYDHLNLMGQICEECGYEVDSYGNTYAQFDYCSFPDCGCDGARLCMATSGPNVASLNLNIEHGTLKH